MADRYWVWCSHIWVDTQPDAPVTPLEMLPRFVVTYLRLSGLPQHMPRPFTLLSPEDGAVSETVLLLDNAPIGSRLTETGEVEPFLLPSLDAAWAAGSALQQLNWLRQIAQLWPSLAQEGVSATLLYGDSLRVDHALLRITELTFDVQTHQTVTLAELGQSWQARIPQARSEIQSYIGWLAAALVQQKIASAEELVAELDHGVRTLAQGLSLDLDWVAYTDQGPERPRNEDACYPEGQLHQARLVGNEGNEIPLLLVCDGIGGHEQGNVASQTAIKILLEELQPLANYPDLSPPLVEERIHRALALANDAIAERNNDENRAARARMGTTVVLALVHFPYVSIAHLGDSRAYRVSNRTCYQITLDDDIASRETRLGYTLYQEALQIPNGGALIQALGIGDSSQLYPSVQHLLIEDPAVLLLCSDGLSDYDRVEMLWRHHLSPLISQQEALQSTGQGLIQQANHLNGHDNVTVGLLRLIPKPSVYSALPAEGLVQPRADSVTTAAQPTTRLVATTEAPNPSATDLNPGGKSRFPWPLVLAGTALVALAAGTVAWIRALQQPEATAMASLTLPLSIVRIQEKGLADMSWAVADEIELGSFWQTGDVSPLRSFQPLTLSPSPSVQPETNSTSTVPTTQGNPASSLVATGSILKVLSQQTTADEASWVRLQVCSIPSGASLDQAPRETDESPPTAPEEPDLSRRLSSPGQSGWTLERNLYRSATRVSQPTVSQRGNCTL